jgi:hypothetical protein
MQTPAQKLVAVRDQFTLKGLSDDALKQILPAYQEAYRRLQFQLATLPPEGASIERELWLRTQAKTIEAQFKPVADRIYQVLPEAEARAFEEGLSNAQKYLEAGGIEPEPVPTAALSGTAGGQQVRVTAGLPGMNITKAVPGGFISPSITRQQVIAAARETGFKVLSPGGSKYGLADLLPKYTAALGKQVETKLRAGFLLGLTNDEIERQVVSVSGELGPGRQGRAMTEALVRTSMAEASQSAHDAFYEANADLLPETRSGFRWWWDASNDTRLCPLCAPLDGVKFKERSSPPAPWPRHFSCRCKILPITATSELLEQEEGPANGSFLEATPVQYDRRGKKLPPPAGWTGDNAYKRPMKIDGQQQWVRRRDLGPGQTTAGDMLQNANEHSKRMVLGKQTEKFNQLTGPGGKYEHDPQGAVRKLLGDPLPPGATAPKPVRGPAPKPPAPQPAAAPKPEPTQAQLLRQRGDELIRKVAPAIDANESIRRRAQTVLTARTKALVAAKTEAEKEAAKAAYLKAGAIVNRSDAKARRAMGELFEAMKQTPMTDKEVKATVDRIDLKQWGTKRDLKKQVKSDVSDFVRMFNGKGFTATENGYPWLQEIAPDVNGRGYNQGGRFIAVRVQNTGNLWHEMMHTVEAQRPWMVEAAQEWAANRADDLPTANKLLKLRGMESGTRRGKPVFRLADIVSESNYANHEIAWSDDYLSPYMGKVYDSGDATEVWTMAVETIASGRAGMVRLHSKHPDLFRMLVGLSQTR